MNFNERKITRRSFLGALLVCAAGALSACGNAQSGAGASSAPSSVSPSASSDASSSAQSAVPESGAPALSESDFPQVDGSTACIPLIALMTSACTGRDLETVQTSISVSTTAYAWESLIDDYYPMLLIVYEAPDYMMDYINASSDALEITPIGRDALVFLANESNPVESLTQEQLLGIYGGSITNWKDVGGADCDIVAFQRSEDSGSQTLFKKLLMQDNPLMDAPTELTPTSMGELVDGVAEYNNAASALGFSVYYYIDQMYSQPGLKLLGVDGVFPSNETIADESYPLCNEFYAAIRADTAADSPTRQVYNWITSPAAASLIRAAGYVAVNG